MIVINGQFPTLNEIIRVSKSHYMAYSTQKKTYTEQAMYHINSLDKIEGKNDWTFVWYRENKRNDPDNIQVGTKYILDAFVKAGVIENDGWNEINSITHKFRVDKDNPRVEIFIGGVEK